jgi:hypothetical protein
MIHKLKITDRGLELLNRPHVKIIIDISRAKKKYREDVISKAVKDFFNKPEAYTHDFHWKSKVFSTTQYLTLSIDQKTICRFGYNYDLPATGFVFDFDELFEMEKQDLDLGDIDCLQEKFTELKELL